MSNSLRQVVFAIALANSVLNLPDMQVKFYGEFKLIEMTFGLVHGSYILPLRQAVKLTLHPVRKLTNLTIGPFIRGKIRCVLHKTRTFRINGTFRLK